MRDDRTENFDLPLPHPDNFLEHDVPRLREALTQVDALVASAADLQAETKARQAALAAETKARSTAIATVAMLPGMIFPFSGSFDNSPGQNFQNAKGYPLNPATGQPDLRFGVCDGGTFTAPDGRKVTTPDLRGRFVLGVGVDNGAGIYGSAPPGATGGMSDTTLATNSAGSHSHGGSAQATTLAASQMPNHQHTFPVMATSPIVTNHYHYGASDRVSTSNSGSDTPLNLLTSLSGGGTGHSHPLSADAAHTHTVAGIVPAYYALCYIMYL